MATPAKIQRAVKNLLNPRLKNLKVLQKWNYHVFPQPIKTKVKGTEVWIAGVYNRMGDEYKWDGIAILSGIPKDANGVITKNKFDSYITKGKGVKPNATLLKKQAETLIDMMSNDSDKAKSKPVEAPNTSDLRKVSTYLKDNMKSIKGYYATWNKNNEMGITLPFKFKPTIAKFEQTGEADFYIDFAKGKLYTNNLSPKYDQTVGHERDELGSFKDVEQLLSLLKKEFNYTKKETIDRFNASGGNKWHR